MPIYKDPRELSQKIWSVPKYNKDAIVSYLKQYGTGETDDIYKEWALKKGRQLKPTKLNPEFLKTDFARQTYGDATETYADQYLNDDEWLQERWPEIAEDALDYYNNIEDQEYEGVDADYERSYGPVDTRSKYAAYLEWLKEGN